MAKYKNNKKYYKVRRTHDGSNRRITPLEIIIATVAIVALIGVGWVSYTPVYNYIMKLPQNDKNVPSSSSQPEEITPKQEETPLPKEEEPPKAVAVKSVYIPFDIIKDEEKLDKFLTEIDGMDINAVMVELKDSKGNILYNTSNELAIKAQSISPEAIDIDKLTAKLKSKNLTLMARINAFRDSIAPNLLHQASVKYLNTDINWIDNYSNQGGKLWLNPYHELAWQYITELSVEITGKGFEYIMLDGVQFPTGVGLDKAYYGDKANTVDKPNVLNSFAKSITSAVEKVGGKVLTYVPADAVLGLNNYQYDGEPVKTIDKGVVWGVMPSIFGEKLTTSSIIIDTPIKTPYETVNKVMGAILPMVTGDITAFGMVQCYTADGIKAEANKEYTAEDINAQIKALEDNKIYNYILYDTNGNYKLK